MYNCSSCFGIRSPKTRQSSEPSPKSESGKRESAFCRLTLELRIFGTTVGCYFRRMRTTPSAVSASVESMTKVEGSGTAAAGIAVINSLANLGGYFGPDIIGKFRTANGGFKGGLLAIAATLAISGIVALIVGRQEIFNHEGHEGH